MQRLLETMRRLRAPDGCPWDREQTHETLRPYLLEEAAEAVDALSSGDAGAMAEELGDVLLQVAFHAVIAEEAGRFSYEDIEGGIVEKLERRHPHVFGDVRVSGAEQVVRNWQAIKAAEKETGETSPAERVPRSLSALMRAAELGRKLGWEAGSKEAVVSALDAGEVGALLLAVVDYARAQGVNPELALREAADARAHGTRPAVEARVG
ncbi:MazG family protein [Truepera radiovictrix]|uniref:MazG family protein n=1 Tax=Truepera radiovictrix (strain DSM 17093 / CIP 108686 / LMG 22925 / RQ-24) TaxID=649638 RepID=D7CR56_TRURR|nr:MazG family protein [Truepera radiovictrix]ADI15144.1 MazG family protein [Truepera radiovictrix DSM 17093]WMT56303.1 MazG family protein [Truepera radiovictrix]